MTDPLHKQIVQEALSDLNFRKTTVEISFADLLLFHTLIQDYGLELLTDEQFIAAMERNKARIDAI